MHIKKSGGTGVCKAMRLHQKKVNTSDMLGNHDKHKISVHNCNTELTHPHLHDDAFHAVQTCCILELYTLDDAGTPFGRPNFLAVEIPLADPMPCQGFHSLTLMREPLSRVLSHLQFHRYSENTVTQWVNRRLNGNTHRDYFLNGYHSVNNMVIRQLLRLKRYNDVRPIDKNDLEQAKARVNLFSVFVPLEYLRHEKVLRLLNSTIPEYYEALMNSEEVVVNKNDNVTLQYSPAFLERLAKENEYDTKLYQYVLQKLGIDDVG